MFRSTRETPNDTGSDSDGDSDSDNVTVIKPPLGPTDSTRRHEADLLERTHHRGIVELVEAIESPDGTALRLARVEGADDLSQPRSLSAAAIADVVRQVADAAAYLHGLGAVHSRIAPEHVLVDEQHRVVLCGFSGWRPLSAGGDAPAATTSAVDVAAMGRLLGLMVDRADSAGEDPTLVALRQLAALAVADPDAGGATRLRDRLAAVAAGQETASSRWERIDGAAITRVATGLVVGVACVAIIAVAAGVVRDDPSPVPEADVALQPAAPLEPVPPSTEVIAADDGRRGLVTATPISCPNDELDRAIEATVADLDAIGWAEVGNDCPARWRFDNGILTVADRRYAVSDAERIRFVDWDCDGFDEPMLIDAAGAGHIIDALPSDSSTPASIDRVVDDGLGAEPGCVTTGAGS